MENAIFVVILVLMGFLLKRLGIFKRSDANLFIRIVFYIFLPATLFHSLIKLDLKFDLIILPLSASFIALMCYGFAYLIKKFFSMDRREEGIFLIASGAMNQGLFSYPFFLIYLGTKGLSYVAFYDLGQAILALTLGYCIATKYGGRSKSYSEVLRNVLAFPPLIAFMSAIFVNLFGISKFLGAMIPFIEMLHNCTTPLIMLSLGIFLEFENLSINLKPIFGVLFIRFVFSLGVALLLVNLLNLGYMEKITILIASSVPSAMLTLVYAVEEELDVEFTTLLLSIGICIGLIYIPILFSILID